MQYLKADGHEKEDHNSIVKFYEAVQCLMKSIIYLFTVPVIREPFLMPAIPAALKGIQFEKKKRGLKPKIAHVVYTR